MFLSSVGLVEFSLPKRGDERDANYVWIDVHTSGSQCCQTIRPWVHNETDFPHTDNYKFTYLLTSLQRNPDLIVDIRCRTGLLIHPPTILLPLAIAVTVIAPTTLPLLSMYCTLKPYDTKLIWKLSVKRLGFL